MPFGDKGTETAKAKEQSPALTFKICGLRHPKHVFDWNNANKYSADFSKFEELLTSELGVVSTAYKLLFHRPGEYCYALRPLGDLGLWDKRMVVDKTFHIHLHRKVLQGTQKEDAAAAPQGDQNAAPAKQDDGGQSNQEPTGGPPDSAIGQNADDVDPKASLTTTRPPESEARIWTHLGNPKIIKLKHQLHHSQYLRRTHRQQ